MSREVIIFLDNARRIDITGTLNITATDADNNPIDPITGGEVSNLAEYEFNEGVTPYTTSVTTADGVTYNISASSVVKDNIGRFITKQNNWNATTLNIENTLFEGNSHTAGWLGATTINNSYFINNTLTNGASGGNINNSMFINNTGNAVSGGTVNNSVFRYNDATDTTLISAHLNNSLLENNTAGNLISSGTTVDSVIRNNTVNNIFRSAGNITNTIVEDNIYTGYAFYGIGTISDSIFKNNTKEVTGSTSGLSYAHYINGTTGSIKNSSFINNSVISTGGGVGGGILDIGTYTAFALIDNTLFEGNSMQGTDATGGIIRMGSSGYQGNPKITNSIFRNNYALATTGNANGGIIWLGGANDRIEEISDSLFEGNYIVATNGLANGGVLGNSRNEHGNPYFGKFIT